MNITGYALTKIKIQPPIIYTNTATVQHLYKYHPSAGYVALTTHHRSDWPVVMLNGNGTRAIAVVTRQIGGPVLTSSMYASDSAAYYNPQHPENSFYSGYAGNGNTGVGYGYMGRDYEGWAPAGQHYNGSTFVFETYIWIGTQAMVTGELNYLHSQGIF